MKILIMGGTFFLGRHLVEAARQNGHEITLFNRGLHNPGLFPDLENLRGDRDHDLAALRGRSFDAVIDPSAYTPDHIERLLDALAEPPAHYALISSISVYDKVPPGHRYDEETARTEGHEGYGALKARAEDALLAALPECAAVVRPGLIVGPFDPTDRFTYWLRRLDLGGHVLAPGRPERPLQFIDARDLAAWSVYLAEYGILGVFNAVGPDYPLSMAELLEACREIAGKAAQFEWLSDAQVTAAGIEGWTELPLWLPEQNPENGGIFLADNRRALQCGLKIRPLRHTIADTLAWAREVGTTPDSPLRAQTLTAQKEHDTLAAYGDVSA